MRSKSDRHVRCRAEARTIAVAMVAVAAVCLSVASRPVHAETLRQALASAYQNNPKLDAERARLRATDEEVPRALSGYRPRITGQADGGMNRLETKPKTTSDGECATLGVFRHALAVGLQWVADAECRQ